eukprot:c16537_g1_i1.p1 GENE.c16537_g1_i1~~c16537_g1_i1.p1  ORF type:complete len:180 (+),score=27.69 c16537_g1_i1:95-634(+)
MSCDEPMPSTQSPPFRSQYFCSPKKRDFSQLREIETEIVPTARELGVAIVAYSPLGRGFLSNTFTKIEDLPANDWRRSQPRFNEQVMADNVARLDRFKAKAVELGVTPAQLALAWVHSVGEDVFPIPGTKTAPRVIENARAALIQLSAEQVKELGDLVDVVGLRYGDLSATHERQSKNL